MEFKKKRKHGHSGLNKQNGNKKTKTKRNVKTTDLVMLICSFAYGKVVKLLPKISGCNGSPEEYWRITGTELYDKQEVWHPKNLSCNEKPLSKNL